MSKPVFTDAANTPICLPSWTVQTQATGSDQNLVQSPNVYGSGLYGSGYYGQNLLP